MKQIPTSFRNLLSSGVAVEPFALAAIWHDPNAIEDKLLTPTRLIAADDAATVNDTNIRVSDGKIALDKGNTVSMGVATSSDNTYHSVNWNLVVSEVGSMEWK